MIIWPAPYRVRPRPQAAAPRPTRPTAAPAGWPRPDPEGIPPGQHPGAGRLAGAVHPAPAHPRPAASVRSGSPRPPAPSHRRGPLRPGRGPGQQPLRLGSCRQTKEVGQVDAARHLTERRPRPPLYRLPPCARPCADRPRPPLLRRVKDEKRSCLSEPARSFSGRPNSWPSSASARASFDTPAMARPQHAGTPFAQPNPSTGGRRIESQKAHPGPLNPPRTRLHFHPGQASRRYRLPQVSIGRAFALNGGLFTGLRARAPAGGARAGRRDGGVRSARAEAACSADRPGRRGMP